MDSNVFFVKEEEAGIRLDKMLSSKFPQYSRTYFQYLIEKELVLIDGMPVKKRFKLEAGAEIEIEFALTQETALTAEPIPLDILYEDAYILAVNKPAGMVVHPGAGNWSGTFVNALLHHCKQLPNSNTLRPGIVHRLDKGTSGVLLAAKTEEAHQNLVQAFANKLIKKRYLAISLGNPGNRAIEAPIGRNPSHRKEMAVVAVGKQAKTYCETIAFDGKFGLLALYPETGRTHQLRVHLRFIGSPILGDPTYGISHLNKKYHLEHQFLHAESVRFLHPITQKEIVIIAPIPNDMDEFLKKNPLLFGYKREIYESSYSKS